VKRHEKRLSAPAYRRLCERLFSERGGHCERCGGANGLSFHHVVFRSRGGSDTPKNLKLLCLRCHEREHGAKIK
jgi:5-methylcytosine-specific restriction endonuclease McrA